MFSETVCKVLKNGLGKLPQRREKRKRKRRVNVIKNGVQLSPQGALNPDIAASKQTIDIPLYRVAVRGQGQAKKNETLKDV